MVRVRTDSTGAGLALAVMSAAMFGTSGSFATSLIDAGWSPAAAVTARTTIAAIVLLVPAVVQLRQRWPELRAGGRPLLVRTTRMLALYGLVAVAGAQLFFFHAVERLSVGVALLMEYLGIILVVGWLWLRHGHRPRRLTVMGSVGALLGLALVLNLTGGQHVDLIGVLWGLGAAVGLAVYFVVSAREDVPVPSIAMACAGLLIASVTFAVLGLIGVLPLHATFGQVSFSGHRTSWLVPVLGLSIVAAAFSYVTGIAAARLLGAKLSSFVGLTEVLFAVLFAWVLLGQLPSGMQLLGGLFIIGGVALVRVDELSAPQVPAVELDPLLLVRDDELAHAGD